VLPLVPSRLLKCFGSAKFGTTAKNSSKVSYVMVRCSGTEVARGTYYSFIAKPSDMKLKAFQQLAEHGVCACPDAKSKSLSGADDLRYKLMNFGAVATVIATLAENDRFSVFNLIDEFARHGKISGMGQVQMLTQRIDDLRRQMLDSDIAEALLAKLGDGYSIVRRSVLNSIVELGKYGASFCGDSCRDSSKNR
jgi:hypothetical protein